MSASAAPVSPSDTVIDAPPGLVARVRTALTGLAMTAGGGFMLAAMAAHDPLDPSLNAATAGPVSNWLGAPGAVASDLILQVFGWSGAAGALALIAWGLILLVRGPRRRGGWLGVFRLASGLAGACGFGVWKAGEALLDDEA